MSQKHTEIEYPSHDTHLVKTPKLRSGHDVERAEQLESYIQEAESGVRSILKAGFFLECLAADLPHGMLGPWVEAHCRRKWRTVQRWKQVAGELAEAVGLKDMGKRVGLRLHEVLALPMAKLSDDVRVLRQKIDAEIEGKTYRQLFLSFKQSKDGESPARGRLKGSDGNPRDKRIKAQHLKKAADIAGRRAQFCQLGDLADLYANDAGAGDPDLANEFEEVFPKIENLFRYMQRVNGGRA